ncbi:hypothetical protein PVK06_006075 [Gossypium arboreum]|uniref:Uncharacterized protein n=1 Tax=Gossypium arboreum TaxID=29729 RepID=A0ABR0QXJ7_GOSAR|nr:hypothetical protein PVK06_006075 [Gossypium arboreum]
MACQDLLLVVALIFMVVVGAFAVESSPSPVPSKASSPLKSVSSLVSSPKSPSIKSQSQSSNGSSLSPSNDNPNANKEYSSELESPEEVSSPPSPTANDEVFDSPSPSPKSMGDVVDSESLAPAPTPSNDIEIKATTCIFGVVTIFGFFLF